MAAGAGVCLHGGGEVDGKQADRLRSRGDFEKVFRSGRTVAHRLVVVRLVRNGLGRSRVGFAVGRQLGGAVVRNRARRRWREVVRLGPPLPPGWDVVLVARGAALDAQWTALAGAWREALARSGLVSARG